MEFKRTAVLFITIVLASSMLTISMTTIGIGESVKKVVEEPEHVVVAPPGPEPSPKSTIAENYNTSRTDLSPALREVVVVHFKEMPTSLDKYASAYGGKLIFVKNDINFAAFEMNPRASTPLKASQRTQDLMSMMSKDACVEEARLDTFQFVDPNRTYTQGPMITYPEDLVKQGVKSDEITNHIMVSFWMFPPSLEEFAKEHGGKLMNFSEANKNLICADFETDDVDEFLNSLSKDPYVRTATPDSIRATLF